MLVCDKCLKNRSNIQCYCFGWAGSDYPGLAHHDLCPDCAREFASQFERFVGNYEKEADKVIADKDKEILNLKAKNIELQSFYDLHGNVDNYIDKLEAENAQLNEKLDNVRASIYRDVVDANMENRILKRALWLARAERANARKDYWYARSCHEGDDFLVSIDGSPVKYIGCIKRTNFDWLKIWSEVECKCLKKAEEYK